MWLGVVIDASQILRHETICNTLQVKHGSPVLCFKEREGCKGGGKGILTDENGKAFTLSTLRDQAVCYDARGNGGGA